MRCICAKRLLGVILGTVLLLMAVTSGAVGEENRLHLRHQVETSPDSGRYHQLVREEIWRPEQTAVIVCDMWDLHHGLNSVRRLNQFAPRLNEVLNDARSRGITIIHAPSSCMGAYSQHPARKRATSAPVASPQPEGIGAWCSSIPSEERAVYPIDQSDGGEDDESFEHAEWAAQLVSMGRDSRRPWKQQTPVITIDAERDFISDQGDEVWNILQSRGIQNVILTGVHTNFCVLGRPFGLRQLVRHGKNVVLMRDMTDTMYNPLSWPYVSHFTGTDLIVDHIERFVCPTIESDQFIGGDPFRFHADQRPHVVIVMAEDEYRTAETLPRFAAQQLGRDFRVTLVFASEQNRNKIPGLNALQSADLMLISVRRRVLPPNDMDAIRRYVTSGRPVIGIRTASHAFSLRNAKAPEGLVDWPEFDAEVFGGNYHGHLGNKLESTIHVVANHHGHPALSGIAQVPFRQGWSLYETSPLAPGATTLLTGRAEGHSDEPVAWTFTRREGGRSFYTSLGHVDDFSNPVFVRLLRNSIYWAVGGQGSRRAIAPGVWLTGSLTLPAPRIETR